MMMMMFGRSFFHGCVKQNYDDDDLSSFHRSVKVTSIMQYDNDDVRSKFLSQVCERNFDYKI